MTWRDRAARQVRLIRSEIRTDTCVLNRIRRQRQIDRGWPAIENLDKGVAELGARIISAAINLADDEIRGVVVDDRSSRLRISVRAGDFDKEGFVRLDQCVAVNRHLKVVGLLALWDELVRQTLRKVIGGRDCCAVKRGDVE